MTPNKRPSRLRDQPRFNSINRSGDIFQETESLNGRHNQPQMLEPKCFLDFRSAGRVELVPLSGIDSFKSDNKSQIMVFSDSENYVSRQMSNLPVTSSYMVKQTSNNMTVADEFTYQDR